MRLCLSDCSATTLFSLDIEWPPCRREGTCRCFCRQRGAVNVDIRLSGGVASQRLRADSIVHFACRHDCTSTASASCSTWWSPISACSRSNRLRISTWRSSAARTPSRPCSRKSEQVHIYRNFCDSSPITRYGVDWSWAKKNSNKETVIFNYMKS